MFGFWTEAGMQTNYARQFGLIEGCSARFYLGKIGLKKENLDHEKCKKSFSPVRWSYYIEGGGWGVWGVPQIFRFQGQKFKRSKIFAWDRMIPLYDNIIWQKWKLYSVQLLYIFGMYNLTNEKLAAHWFICFWAISADSPNFLNYLWLVHNLKFLKLDFCLDFDRCTPDLWTYLPFLFIWTQFLFNTQLFLLNFCGQQCFRVQFSHWRGV